MSSSETIEIAGSQARVLGGGARIDARDEHLRVLDAGVAGALERRIELGIGHEIGEARREQLDRRDPGELAAAEVDEAGAPREPAEVVLDIGPVADRLTVDR